MTHTICSRCQARGKTWDGDDPRCAFPNGQPFTASNWNCATVNDVRDRVEDLVQYHDDQSYVLVPWDGEEFSGALVLSWYKSRGQTEILHVITGDQVRPATLAEVEEFLRTYPQRK